MWRLVLAITTLAALVLLAGCGSSSSETVVTTSLGPHLGNRCRAQTTINSTVEVQTVRGPLKCSEAQTILAAYYSSAAQTGHGSGGGLQIASWYCLTSPPPEAPLAGHCFEKRTGREFQMYEVSSTPTATATSNAESHSCPTFVGPGDSLVHSKGFGVSGVSCTEGQAVVSQCQPDGRSCDVDGRVWMCAKVGATLPVGYRERCLSGRSKAATITWIS